MKTTKPKKLKEYGEREESDEAQLIYDLLQTATGPADTTWPEPMPIN